MKIGIIKERKQPADTRVALTPLQCKNLTRQFQGLQVVVESSDERCFSDHEYQNEGIPIVDDLSDCDVLLGVKEVPVEALIENKTYLFFSHTIKKQPHNREMFHTILKKNITLIDYECLHWPKGGRILGFGNWAGIVGTYNAFLVWGKKTGEYELKPAWKCKDYNELKSELNKIKTKKIGIALTGDGRVAAGCREILSLISAIEMVPESFCNTEKNTGIYFVHLNNSRLYERKGGV